MTTQITDASFDKQVLQSEVPVLVDFWAEWCGPCKMIAPTLNELSTEFDGKLVIAKLNIDENPVKPTEFGIRSIPTMMLFKGGKLIDQRVGAMRKGDLHEWLSKAIA